LQEFFEEAHKKFENKIFFLFKNGNPNEFEKNEILPLVYLFLLKFFLQSRYFCISISLLFFN
jgi:hypothetical protein